MIINAFQWTDLVTVTPTEKYINVGLLFIVNGKMKNVFVINAKYWTLMNVRFKLLMLRVTYLACGIYKIKNVLSVNLVIILL